MKTGRRKANGPSPIDDVLLEYMQEDYYDANQVENLFKEGGNVHVKGDRHHTPLHFAGKHGHADVAELLIEHGACINRTGKEQWPPIFMSLGRRHFGITRMLLAKDADVSVMSNNGHSVLSWIITTGNAPLDLIRELVEKGISVHSKVSSDKTPLHLAIYRANLELVNLLLSAGADVNVADLDGGTPLHVAASCNFLDIGSGLLKVGALLEARNVFGETPLHLAAFYRSTQVLILLLNSGSEVNARDVRGATPLHHAAQNGENVLNLLVKHHADVCAVDKKGRTSEDIAHLHSREQAIGFFNALKSRELIGNVLRRD